MCCFPGAVKTDRTGPPSALRLCYHAPSRPPPLWQGRLSQPYWRTLQLPVWESAARGSRACAVPYRAALPTRPPRPLCSGGARVGFTRVAPALEFLTLYYTAHVVSILLKAGTRGRTSPQFSLTQKCVHEATQMFHCSVHFCYDYKSTTLVWGLQVNFRN